MEEVVVEGIRTTHEKDGGKISLSGVIGDIFPLWKKIERRIILVMIELDT